MAKIEGIRIKNFRGLKDVTLGRLGNNPEAMPLSDMTVVIGKNGVGKSTLFDVFGFLADALKFGVEDACNLRGRGGFEKLRSQGETGAIEFEIAYKEDGSIYPIGYEISVDINDSERTFVTKELLFQDADEDTFFFLGLSEGAGFALNENKDGFKLDLVEKILSDAQNKVERNQDMELNHVLLNDTFKEKGVDDAEAVELTDDRRLGIATLGALKQHPRIAAFRQFMESWYLSYFTPDAARNIPSAGIQQHLNSKGDNLANVVQFMELEYRKSFQDILNRIAKKIPGIESIESYRDPITNNLYLLFNNQGFAKPFSQLQMSDGTLKVFAYLLLLEDPTPPPLICIEEPENGLYHKLLEILAAEFRAHTKREDGAQLFITTHQPYFVDALDPEEVWILEKGEDGFSTIRRASDDDLVKNMVAEGLPLGGLWYSDYLDAR